MADLGTKDNPLVFRVNNEDRYEEMVSICIENEWVFIGGIEPNKPEDIVEVEYLLNPEAFRKPPKLRRSNIQTVVNTAPKIGRNNLVYAEVDVSIKNVA